MNNRYPALYDAPGPVVLTHGSLEQLQDGTYTVALGQGAEGPQGPPGATGPQGPRGEVGPAGNSEIRVVEKFVLSLLPAPTPPTAITRNTGRTTIREVPFVLPNTPLTLMDLVKSTDPWMLRNRGRIRWLIERLARLERELAAEVSAHGKKLLRGLAQDQMAHVVAQMR